MTLVALPDSWDRISPRDLPAVVGTSTDCLDAWHASQGAGGFVDLGSTPLAGSAECFGYERRLSSRVNIHSRAVARS